MYEVPSIAAAMQNARMPYSELGHGFVVARSPGPPLACSAMSEPARLAAMPIEMLAFNVAIVSAISLF